MLVKSRSFPSNFSSSSVSQIQNQSSSLFLSSNELTTELLGIKRTIHYSDGSIYKGEVVNNEPHGVGIMTFPQGSKLGISHNGHWDKGLPMGYGIRTVIIEGTTQELSELRAHWIGYYKYH